MKPLRVAIFASGMGSNALALIKKAKEHSSQQIEIRFVLSDKAAAPVLAKAGAEGVKTYVIEKKTDRSQHEQEILSKLSEHQIDWIFLAGYMRLLSPAFLDNFASWHGGASQVVNIHPSLLPAYPGVDSISLAFKDQVKQSGVTIHLVDEGMDTGSILMQSSLPLETTDNLEQWIKKIHELEHRMYTSFLESLIHGERKTCYFEGIK